MSIPSQRRGSTNMVKPEFSELADYMATRPSTMRQMLEIFNDFRLHPDKYKRDLIYFAGGPPGDAPPPALRDAALEVLNDSKLFNTGAKYGVTGGEPELITDLTE